MAQRQARWLRKNSTDAENRLWLRLRNRQFAEHKFRRQVPIGPYVVDFVCFEQSLVVAIDGGQHTANVEQDDRRTAWLESEGYRVVRFWNNEVLRDSDAVLTALERTLSSD